MKQHARFKAEHPGCVLFFQMGDFYELFGEDARTMSLALGLTLTERAKGLPMAGVPVHQGPRYIKRAVDLGYRVAVCEQIQDPKDARGVVERAVTQVITPGTLIDESLIEDDRAVRIAAVSFVGEGDDAPAAAAIVELGTGVVEVLDATADRLLDELSRRHVAELVCCELANGDIPPRAARVVEALEIASTPRPAWQFRPDEALQAVQEQYGVRTLEGFGLAENDPAVLPLGALIRYLRETRPSVGGTDAGLPHLRPPRRQDPESICRIDAASQRALEIDRTIRSGTVDGSLIGIFLRPRSVCSTPMGKRLLREWLLSPLADFDAIRARQAGVATLVEDERTAEALAEALAGVQDVARIAGRLALGRPTPRDLVALGRSLDRIGAMLEAVDNAPALESVRRCLLDIRDRVDPVSDEIRRACVDDAPAHLREGGLIRDGYDAALDEARTLRRDAGSWLAEYQASLIAEFDLPSLKVGYNKVFGYYIELPSAQARRAPDRLTRKQTLKNAERYITPELKQFEDKVTSAEATAIGREQRLFEHLCELAGERVDELQRFADAAATLDATLGLASKSVARGWVRPEFDDGIGLSITEGRHPVLDESLETAFVPNDLTLGVAGPDVDQPAALALITGPNMAGKSTFIRQTALLVLLAQTGSFVPASSMSLGVCDRIFTRVGADDALHRGQSTFMVEMTETANILNHATERSLVILDEIGRGTSTLDGLSLAWAITERLAEIGARTLFATHYHELTDLEDRLPTRVKNLAVAVREWNEQIIFLHSLRPGRADQSYGVQVAKLAGIPGEVVERARRVLESLRVEHAETASGLGRPGASTAADRGQLALFQEPGEHPVVGALRGLDLESMTPLEAFDALRRLRDQAVSTGQGSG